jgi:hypothetical protein
MQPGTYRKTETKRWLSPVGFQNAEKLKSLEIKKNYSLRPNAGEVINKDSQYYIEPFK